MSDQFASRMRVSASQSSYYASRVHLSKESFRSVRHLLLIANWYLKCALPRRYIHW